MAVRAVRIFYFCVQKRGSVNEYDNKMSLGQLTLVTAVNMIGAGIIMLPSQLAQVGAVSVFAWIISTMGAMSLAYAFAKCGLYSKKGRPGRIC